MESHEQHQIDLFGPRRSNNSWQTKTEGAYDQEKFAINWENERVTCPEGKQSISWQDDVDNTGNPLVYVREPAKATENSDYCLPSHLANLDCHRMRRRHGPN